jgi:nicotinamidase-related amidase
MPPAPRLPHTALVVVDMQCDFVRGSLAVPDAEAIVPLVAEARQRYVWDLVVFTADAHPPSHESFVENITDTRLSELENKTAAEVNPFDEVLLETGETQVSHPALPSSRGR